VCVSMTLDGSCDTNSVISRTAAAADAQKPGPLRPQPPNRLGLKQQVLRNSDPSSCSPKTSTPTEAKPPSGEPVVKRSSGDEASATKQAQSDTKPGTEPDLQICNLISPSSELCYVLMFI
jgi:hypothetical protein